MQLLVLTAQASQVAAFGCGQVIAHLLPAGPPGGRPGWPRGRSTSPSVRVLAKIGRITRPAQTRPS